MKAWGRAARLAVQVALVILCLAPVGRQLVQGWGSIGALAGSLQAGPLIGAGLLLIVSSLLLPVALAAYARGSRGRIGFRDSAVAYYGSQPMKYLPGSFWILPGRVMLLKRMGHDVALSSGGLLFEMTTQVLSSALVVAALAGAAGFASVGMAGGVWAVLAGSILACALLLGCPALVCKIRRLPASVRDAAARLASIPPRARLANLAVTLATLTAMWLIMGASFYLLVVAGDPRLDLTLLKTAVVVSTLSWLAGFLTPFAPGGIGIREAAIVLLLAGVTGQPEATLVAALSRALALVVELAFALGAWPALRSVRTDGKSPRARPPEPSRSLGQRQIGVMTSHPESDARARRVMQTPRGAHRAHPAARP